jgi:hypothetical protein
MVGVHRKGTDDDPENLYQTERDLLDHTKLLELQHELSLTTEAELNASYELKETLHRMLPLGGAIRAAAGQYLRGTADLRAVFLSVNEETPTPELNTTHIEGSPLITDTVRHPFCPGSLTLALDDLAHPMPETYQVTRHEFALAGHMSTRRRRSITLQQAIRQQLALIRDYDDMNLLDYDPIARLSRASDKEDQELEGIRSSFRSFLHHLE